MNLICLVGSLGYPKFVQSNSGTLIEPPGRDRSPNHQQPTSRARKLPGTRFAGTQRPLTESHLSQKSDWRLKRTTAVTDSFRPEHPRHRFQFFLPPSCDACDAFSTPSEPDTWLGGHSLKVERNCPHEHRDEHRRPTISCPTIRSRMSIRSGIAPGSTRRLVTSGTFVDPPCREQVADDGLKVIFHSYNAVPSGRRSR